MSALCEPLEPGPTLPNPPRQGRKDYDHGPPAPLGQGRWRAPHPGVRKKRSPLAILFPLLRSGLGQNKCQVTSIGQVSTLTCFSIGVYKAVVIRPGPHFHVQWRAPRAHENSRENPASTDHRGGSGQRYIAMAPTGGAPTESPDCKGG